MTLRLRLVVGLVLLVLIGLAIFGFSTYGLYSRSEHDRLDDELRSAIPAVTSRLFQVGKLDDPLAPQVPEQKVFLPVGIYAAFYDANFVLVVQGSDDASPYKPDIADALADPGINGRIFTTGPAVGNGEWRVSITRVTDARPRLYVVVAIPTRAVRQSLRRLVIIELSAAGGLLLILGIGSWFILRRGLRPLEQMADSTLAITAGDLSKRVQPSDGRTEVGQLGLALNTMLGELEEAFKERDETEQKLRQFLADASHELRTPLTSIQGFAELFRLGADNPDLDLPLVLRRIEQESERMKVLVEDLLLLARLDQPRPIQRTSVDLAVLCADACSDARAFAVDRPIALDAREPVVIRGDRDHLRQAIANLVTNAVRHTPDDTEIEVATRFSDGFAEVTVRDHGPGLAPDALVHAFDRFWQADSARVGVGSGLGLAIVQSIAHEHGGVAAASNAPGGGALFTLRLPIGDPLPPPPAEQQV